MMKPFLPATYFSIVSFFGKILPLMFQTSDFRSSFFISTSKGNAMIAEADQLPVCLFRCLDKDYCKVAIQKIQQEKCIVAEMTQQLQHDIEIWEKVTAAAGKTFYCINKVYEGTKFFMMGKKKSKLPEFKFSTQSEKRESICSVFSLT